MYQITFTTPSGRYLQHYAYICAVLDLHLSFKAFDKKHGTNADSVLSWTDDPNSEDRRISIPKGRMWYEDSPDYR